MGLEIVKGVGMKYLNTFSWKLSLCVKSLQLGREIERGDLNCA